MKATILKIGAVVSALALGGTYIVIQQRSGAKRVEAPSPPGDPTEEGITLMPGSKSPGGDLILPLPHPKGSDEAPPVLMPSSKVIVMPVFGPADEWELQVPPDVADPIMSSSKSGSIELDSEELKKLLELFKDYGEPLKLDEEKEEEP